MQQNHNLNGKLEARKIHRLVEYLVNVGIDPYQIASRVDIDLNKILGIATQDSIPSIYYALIYKESVTELEKSGKNVPWAAGLGSQNFKMMCYSITSCKTLGDAISRAQAFNELMFPLIGQQVSLQSTSNNTVIIQYDIDESFIRRSFSPNNWSLKECFAVANSSGVEIWLGLCGWLIGRKINPINVTLASDHLPDGYHTRLLDLFQCNIDFNAGYSSIEIPSNIINFRIVHDSDSVEDFLETGPYQLWSIDNKLISTTAAVKSLLGNDFSNGLQSFDAMASNMHMSASTLRRHLLQEGSSYQKIKDERRKDIAIELLCLSDDKISDISERVGFSDTSSFVRSFRAWTGLTPKSYRDQSRPLRIEK